MSRDYDKQTVTIVKSLAFHFTPRTTQSTHKKVKIRNLLTQIDPDLLQENDIHTIFQMIDNKSKAKI